MGQRNIRISFALRTPSPTSFPGFLLGTRLTLHLTGTGQASNHWAAESLMVSELSCVQGSNVARVFHVSRRPLCFDRVLIYPQELNVRKVTVSSDKHKFGVQLRAEPDNQTLGRRLKGAFKQVSQAIKGILYQSTRLIQSVEYLVHVIS